MTTLVASIGVSCCHRYHVDHGVCCARDNGTYAMETYVNGHYDESFTRTWLSAHTDPSYIHKPVLLGEFPANAAGWRPFFKDHRLGGALSWIRRPPATPKEFDYNR